MEDFVASLGIPLLAHRLRRLSEDISDQAEASFKLLGMRTPPRSVSTLLLLDAHGPMGPVEIADRLRLTHPLIIRMVKILEERGLISSSTDVSDARRRIIKLTPAGAAEVTKLKIFNTEFAAKLSQMFCDIGIDGMDFIQRMEAALNTKVLAQATPKPQVTTSVTSRPD